MEKTPFLNTSLHLKKNTFLTYCLLFILWSVGLYLRTSGTFKGFFAFTFDQGRDMLTLHEMTKFGNWHLVGNTSAIEGVFHGAWWHWFLAPFFMIFRGDPMYIVASFNFLSSLLIPLGYKLGKNLGDELLGLYLAALVSVSSFFIGSAAQLWHPNVEPIIVVLLLFALLNYLKKGKSLFWIGFMLGSSFEFHLLFGSMLVLVVLITLLIFRKPRLKGAMYCIIGLVIWFVPRVIFNIRNHFIELESLQKYISAPTAIGGEPFIARLYFRGTTFFQNFVDAFGNRNKDISLFLICLAVIGLIRFWRISAPTQKRFVAWVLSIILGLFILASLYPSALWDYYLVGLPSLMLPLVGVGMYYLVQNPRGKIVVLVGIIGINAYGHLPKNTETNFDLNPSIYRNQLQVVDAVYEEAERTPFNAIVYTPVVIDYAYHYLFMWRGNAKYGYVPDREKVLSLAFFIIEPDPGQPKLKEAWLRDRIGDGKIMWQKRFLGGIEVEKRLR